MLDSERKRAYCFASIVLRDEMVKPIGGLSYGKVGNNFETEPSIRQKLCELKAYRALGDALDWNLDTAATAASLNG
jgi:hypothetical protein